jgi:PIN domain nuclease of toxin-antitoxin system
MEAPSRILAAFRSHRDPFDRMLVCQALDLGLPLVTSDPQIMQYPVKVVWD